MEQLELIHEKTTLRKKFEEFHENNPAVFQLLVRLARQAKEKGHQKIGIKMLFEVVRWQSMIKTTDTDYKINNNYAPFYSRMIMEQCSDLQGMFDLREMKW